MLLFIFFFFFFSSRRRHTRLQGDWSSDVCSSDLLMLPGGHLLSVLIFFPAVGALALIMLRGDDHKYIRLIAMVVSVAEFLFSLLMLPRVPIGTAGYHLEEFAKRSEEHTSELQSPCNLVCRLLLEKKK